MLHADGRVITPLFRARPGEMQLDTRTGELHPLRADPDGGLHVEGDGETAWGVKFVLVARPPPTLWGCQNSITPLTLEFARSVRSSRCEF
jgi:hypothetical protein